MRDPEREAGPAEATCQEAAELGALEKTLHSGRGVFKMSLGPSVQDPRVCEPPPALRWRLRPAHLRVSEAGCCLRTLQLLIGCPGNLPCSLHWAPGRFMWQGMWQVCFCVPGPSGLPGPHLTVAEGPRVQPTWRWDPGPRFWAHGDTFVHCAFCWDPSRALLVAWAHVQGRGAPGSPVGEAVPWAQVTISGCGAPCLLSLSPLPSSK